LHPEIGAKLLTVEEVDFRSFSECALILLRNPSDLRAASADLINLYAKFELPQQWGVGEAAVADGTHFETQEENLLAERHIRYGKTGGIAYRHIADNYIALFSRFIACGTYEATYILDALLENLSDLKPRRLHADNVSFHKVAGAEEAIRGVGASLRYLPQYSPDLNPIELVFHPAKTFLRKAAERTIEGLHRCVRSFIRTIDPSECMR
jgi:transposase